MARSSAARYSFDEFNRLVTTVRDGGRLRSIELSEVLLRLDRANRLVAESAAAGPRSRTLTLDGAWSLAPGHALALTLRGGAGRQRDTLALTGALERADARQLVFALRRSGDEAGRPDTALALTGRWEADRRNRLTFLVARDRGVEDRLTLQGAWEVGRDHALLYRYRAGQAAGSGNEQVLRFDGAWELPAAGKLVYRLEGSSRSVFAFSARLEQAAVRGGRGFVRSEVGIRLDEGLVQRRVTLSGAWRIRPDRSIALEVPYADGRVQAIRFEGAYALTPRDRISVALQAGRRQPLGVHLTLSRALAANAQGFLQWRADGRERAVIGGVEATW